MKKESIFTKEGFFGCDVFNLRFWKLRRSTLLRKVFSAAVGIRRRFPEEVWSSSGRKKQVDRCSSTFKKKVEGFSQRLGKTGQFFRCFQKQIGILNGKEKHSSWVFLFPDASKVEVFHRRLWSGILNAPDDFSQLSFLKTLLSRTEAASRTLLLPWERPEDCYCDQILTIEVEKMLERRWRFSSSGWDVAAALLTF